VVGARGGEAHALWVLGALLPLVVRRRRRR